MSQHIFLFTRTICRLTDPFSILGGGDRVGRRALVLCLERSPPLPIPRHTKFMFTQGSIVPSRDEAYSDEYSHTFDSVQSRKGMSLLSWCN